MENNLIVSDVRYLDMNEVAYIVAKGEVGGVAHYKAAFHAVRDQPGRALTDDEKGAMRALLEEWWKRKTA